MISVASTYVLFSIFHLISPVSCVYCILTRVTGLTYKSPLLQGKDIDYVQNGIPYYFRFYIYRMAWYAVPCITNISNICSWLYVGHV